VLDGGTENDVLFGDAGNDALTGGAGNDFQLGGLGDDAYFFGTAAAPEVDFLIEQPNEGRDRLDFSELPASDPVNVSLNPNLNPLAVHTNRQVQMLLGGALFFEDVTGGAGDDMLTGNSADNVLIGGAGNDSLSGGAGNDTMAGGTGNDVYQF